MGTGLTRPSFLWDYPLDEQQFGAILAGRATIGKLDRDWAAVRLLEYGTYPEIRRWLALDDLVRAWPVWRGRIRSDARRRGLDFLVEWITQERPDLLSA